jgi:histidinol phosphatase-like enzyme
MCFLTFRHCVFRKPRPGLWEYLEKYRNGNIQIDQSNSFYCGDAAGRVRGKGKKDFSCSDRWFSVGICKYKPGYKSQDLLKDSSALIGGKFI